VVFKPKQRKYCSRKCAVIQIGKDKKGKPLGDSLPAWHQCAKCHALMGMAGKMSGDLVNKDKATICQFRKENGLPTLSKSQATKSVLVKSERFPRQTGKQWWRDNWAGVVDTYWDKCSAIIIAKMNNPQVLLEMNRKSVRDRARRKYAAMKDKRDNVYWVKHKLKNGIKRIYRKIKGKKELRTIEMLGCTVAQAKAHIEKQFKKGMTWSNHGTVWEIDHIIPLAAFDLKRKDHQLLANHFTNLRPEWKALNRLKSDNITVTHQLAFA
jgi:hypothetical protein